jgi:K+-transporting ATPase ATPase A chain
MAVALALIRGFARLRAGTIGNFWVDLTRGTLYVLLPICLLAALFLVSQGVPQSLDAYVNGTTLEGGRQLIARGPVASQEAIKLLSGDGGASTSTPRTPSRTRRRSRTSSRWSSSSSSAPR